MTTPKQPPTRDDESGAADDRFDRRVAIGVVAALAVLGTVGPFGWHLFSSGGGSSNAAGAIVGVVSGGAGSHGNAAVPPAATSTANQAAADASASCAAALGNTAQVGTATGTIGTIGSIGGWAVAATPSVNALRAEAANLHAVVISQDGTAVPTAAKALCDQVGSGGRLAAMPDSVGTAAWQAALSAYVAAATSALAGATGHATYYQSADAHLTQGGQELDALAARIIAVTQG